MRRTIPAWQVVLSDLALILFLTTLAALQGTAKEAQGSIAEAPRSHEVAVYREAAGGLSLAQWLESQPADPRLQQNAALLKRYVDAGRLGRKSGRGFYDYPNPAYADKEFLG